MFPVLNFLLENGLSRLEKIYFILCLECAWFSIMDGDFFFLMFGVFGDEFCGVTDACSKFFYKLIFYLQERDL